jgi:hypothetical protein
MPEPRLGAADGPGAHAEQKLDRFFLLGAGNPAPLPLGESGASSVKGGSERRAALLGCP